MKVVSAKELREGMIAGTNIYSPHGRLLVLENSILTYQMISRIKLYEVKDVAIIEGSLPAPAEERLKKKREVEETFTQKLIASDEYQSFRSTYSNAVDILKESMNGIVLHNAVVNDRLLLLDVIKLFEANRTTFSLLNILHETHHVDDSTYAHSMNVALISRLIGTWMNYSLADLDTLTIAGLLHDIGKCKIPQDLILKPSKLSRQEFEFIKMHPQFGYDILKGQNIDERIKNAALYHHERYDGTGYPSQLMGEDIQPFTAIVSIADVYDALTSARSYRSEMCPFDVISVFENEEMGKFSPQFLLPFLKHIANSYVNCEVLLNDNRTATVIMITGDLTRPIIQFSDGTFLNLNDNPSLYITAIL